MSDTRSSLMQKLLEHKDSGLTTDELSRELGITRTAVQQHLAGLERDGLVSPVASRSTGGRPSRTFGLTERGYEQFPRNYALLTQELLTVAAEELGEEAVERLLGQMAERLAAQSAPSLRGRAGSERLPSVVELMNELGYDAELLPDGQGVGAANCVYHKVARQTRAVCRFDVKLLSSLVGSPVSHRCCMLDGDARCTFELTRQEQAVNSAEPRAGQGEPGTEPKAGEEPAEE